MYVSGNDVYVVGYQHFENSKTVAKLWKNGVAQNLSYGCRGSASSVFVSGNDVYVVGFVECSKGIFSVLWKNGIAQKLNQDGTIQMVGELIRYNSVFVSGEDVYVAGSENNVRNAAIWENNILQVLIENPPLDYENFIIR